MQTRRETREEKKVLVESTRSIRGRVRIEIEVGRFRVVEKLQRADVVISPVICNQLREMAVSNEGWPGLLLQIGNNEPSNLVRRSFPARGERLRNFLNERAIRNAPVHPNPTTGNSAENLKSVSAVFFFREEKEIFEIEESNSFLRVLCVHIYTNYYHQKWLNEIIQC